MPGEVCCCSRRCFSYCTCLPCLYVTAEKKELERQFETEGVRRSVSVPVQYVSLFVGPRLNQIQKPQNDLFIKLDVHDIALPMVQVFS